MKKNMFMNIKYCNKKIYPHLFEYESLGHSLTRKGEEYLEKYLHEIWSERSERHEIYHYRMNILGGDKRIHKIG